jgi:outer membrane protein assembly factor BamB
MKFILLFCLFFIIGCSKIRPEPAVRDLSFFHPVWYKNLDPIHDAGNLPIGFATPLIHENRVFVADLKGHISCFDLESGRLLWSHLEDSPLGGQLAILNDHVLYASYSGRVYSRAWRTGEIKYAVDLKAPIESAPTFYQGRMFIHMRNHQLMALDSETGKILWSYKRAVPFATTLQRVARPLVVANKLFIGFADGFVAAFSIEEGVMLWERKLSFASKFVDVDIHPQIFDKLLLVSSSEGPLSFLNPENGEISSTLPIAPGHTPLIQGDKLIFGSQAGQIVVIDRNRQIQHQSAISETGLSAMTVWKGMYVFTNFQGDVLVVDSKTLAVIEKRHLGQAYSTVFGELAVSGKYLAIYSSRNRLYIFR